MSKIKLLFGIFFLGVWVAAFGQNNVTFQVDMSVQIAKGTFDTAKDTLTARGDFNSWGTTNMAPKAAGSKIYTVTASAATGTLHYKFYFKHLGADNWEGNFATPSSNREMNITAATVLPVVFFNDEAMPSGAAAKVIFKVDMKLPLRQNTMALDSGKVYVAGDINGWSTSKTRLTGPGSDSVYTVEIDTIKSATLIHYKYLFTNDSGKNLTWEGSFSTPSSNREAWIVDGTQTYSNFFDDKDPNIKLGNGTINFQVDMSVFVGLGFFDAAHDTLLLRSSFDSWGDADVKHPSLMNQDPLNPTSYFNTMTFTGEPVSNPEFYKFRMAKHVQAGAFTGDKQYERPYSTGGGNRTINFAGTPSQFTSPATFYFNDLYPTFTVPSGTTVTANFAVDMTNALDPLQVSPPFNPATDTVYLKCSQAAFGQQMGGTGGWLEDGDRSLMLTHSTGNIWTGSIQIKGPGINGFMYLYEFAQKSSTGPWVLNSENSALGGSWSYRVRYMPMSSPNHFVQPYTAVVDHFTKDVTKATTEYELWPQGLTGVTKITSGIPVQYTLDQNYPNPFNPTTKIKFQIPTDGVVRLKVFNILGQEVASLVNEQLKAGSYSVDFNASKVSSGVYIYRIEAGTFSSVKKMMLLK
jgi:hypothetical protein